MAYEQRDNTGSLFRNDRKEADTHPDYKGSALLNGVEHWLDAWINTAKDGSKYMSLKIKRKEQRTEAGYAGSSNAEWDSAAAASRRPFDDDSDSVPF